MPTLSMFYGIIVRMYAEKMVSIILLIFTLLLAAMKLLLI